MLAKCDESPLENFLDNGRGLRSQILANSAGDAGITCAINRLSRRNPYSDKG